MNIFERLHDEIMTLLGAVDDRTRSEAIDMHDVWHAEMEYTAGQVIRYGNGLYRCLQAHTAQADWKPDAASGLWTQVMYRDGIRIIPEVIEAAQAFAKGEKGWCGDVLYVSLMDGNVWTPEAYPGAWEAVQE